MQGLLDWNLVKMNNVHIVLHLNALKWIEKQNGIDIVNNQSHFHGFVLWSPADIMEYLMVEKGMTVEFFSNRMTRISPQFLMVIYRVKGLEGLQRVDPEKFVYDFDAVKFLKSVGYQIEKNSISMKKPSWMYSLICFKVLKYEDLDGSGRKNFDNYVKNHEVKVCKHMYQYAKEIRKSKILTFLLCIRKRYPLFQKEIIWNILDLAYSPINERGSL